MILGNRSIWRRTSWFALFLTFFFAAVTSEWDDAVRAWAQGSPPVWDESSTPLEITTEGRGIMAKAAALGNHPVLIYEFVRNQVAFEPYVGSRFGAVGALERLRANDVDQTLLLAALLRAAFRNLSREEPDMWLVSGSVSIDGLRATRWLGVANGIAVEQYLSTAGLAYDLEGDLSGTDFTLVLHNHAWLRGDLEFGHMRGSRFVDGNDGILADLDPSFVAQEVLDRADSAFSLTGIDSEVFESNVSAYAVKDAVSGAVSSIPERFMLEQVDSGAAVFRQRLEDEGLGIEDVICRRNPTVDQIEALPDSLPFELAGAPETYSLSDGEELDEFLDRNQHRLQVRVVSAADSVTTLTNAVIPTSHLYGRPLVVCFEATESLSSGQQESASLPAGIVGTVAEILLDGVSPDGATTATVAYGTDVLLETAYQTPGLDEAVRTAPLYDSAAAKSRMKTVAGAMFALAGIPSINEGSRAAYLENMLDLEIALSNGGNLFTAAEVLGAPLDFAAQTMLSQSENLVRIASLAGGHRVAQTGEFAMVGLEPVASSGELGTPRFVFATSEGAFPMGSVTSGVDDGWGTDSDALQTVLQLCREALLSYGPSMALGRAVSPVSPGRLIRDANAASMSTYAVTAQNADVLNAGTGRVPDTAQTSLRENLQAITDEEGNLLLLPPAETMMQTGATSNSLGQGWGYIARHRGTSDASDIWRFGSVSAVAGSCAFSQQQFTAKLTPASLICGCEVPTYRDLVETARGGVDQYAGALRATSQAMAAATHPLTALVGEAATSSQHPSELAYRLGSAVVLLHAMLDEFSRPQVLSLRLEAVDADGTERNFGVGEVLNPDYFTTVTAVATFNQIMENVDFAAYDNTTTEIGTYSTNAGGSSFLSSEVRWHLKGTGTTDIFASLPQNASGASTYNGALEVRVSGDVYERSTRDFSSSFVIDTQAPDALVSEWTASPYESPFPMPVRGTAHDLHFDEYKLDICVDDGASDEWRNLRTSSQSVAGIGRLGQWDGLWNGVDVNTTFTVRLNVSDVAGNTTTTQRAIFVHHDATAPVIAITPNPGNLLGEQTFTVNATDSDSGLRRFQVDVDYQRAMVYTENDAALTSPCVLTRSDSWLDTDYGASPPTTRQTFSRTIQTRNFQATRNGQFVVHVRAEDAAGNVKVGSYPFTLTNTLLATYAHPSFLTVGSGAATIFALVVPGQSSSELMEPSFSVAVGEDTVVLDGQCVGGRILNSSSEIVYDPVRQIYVYDAVWHGEDGDSGTVGTGTYTATVSLGGESQNVDLYALDSGPDPAVGIEKPRCTILLKDIQPQVPITGFVECEVLEDVHRTPLQPIEQLLPASTPYWHLSYKPHAAEPVVESSSDVAGGFFIREFRYESNWTEIAHGFDQIADSTTTAPIATWDISKVPVGDYDLRLVSSNGYKYATAVAYGYKVVHSAIIPGTLDDDTTPGVLKLRQVDFSVDFEGFPLDVARSYSSLRAYKKSDFGYGWSLDSLSIEVVDTVDDGERFNGYGDEWLKADITLPDGRTLNYANNPVPPGQNYDYTNCAWTNHEAFVTRPYGQMLWLPGRIATNPYLGDYATVYRGNRAYSEGYLRVQEYLGDTPNGTVACLQLEDKSYIFFKWGTGELLRYDKGDGDTGDTPGRCLDFDTEVVTEGEHPVKKTEITDNLGRSITVERDNDTQSKTYGLVTKITDPRGYAVNYSYNDKAELATITDRCGNVRRLYYEKSDFPHYLTRMVIERSDGTETEIAYDYDDNARLDTIDTGDGSVSMEYDDNGDGTGTQTVRDDTTKGETEVTYDNAGRVTRKVDPAGVVVEYTYQTESTSTVPAGALLTQTEAGVTTTYTYDVSDYVDTSDLYRGYEGIAQKYIDFWFNRLTDNPNTDDYVGSGDQRQLKPGYLTSMQVQPVTVTTPAVGPDGTDTGEGNTVTISYISKDPTGKVTGVLDPEGRDISLSYGTSNCDDSETTAISGPAETLVSNSYIQTGEFIGRLASSITTRGAEVVSTTNYTYDLATFGSYSADLTSVTTTLDFAGLDIDDFWSGFTTSYAEKQTAVTTPASGDATETVTYLDALGSAIYTESSQRGSWSVSIPDPEGRTIFSASSGRHTISVYDRAGLLVKTTQVTYDAYEAGDPLDPDITKTEYQYDDQGRRIATIVDDELVSSVAYTSSDDSRIETTTDSEGNQTATTTDSAGRVVSQKFTSADGEVYETKYGYDEYGRRSETQDPRGLVTKIKYDEAGREIETEQTANGIKTVTRRGYDPQGRTVWSQTPLQALADPEVFTTYLYKTVDTDPEADPNDDADYGQLLGVYHQDNDRIPGVDKGTYTGYYEEYEYDGEGRQTAVIKPVQLTVGGPIYAVRTVTAYNDDGQAETVTFDETGANPSIFTFSYDEQGNRSQVQYPGSAARIKQWNYTYENDRPTQLQETHPGGATWKTTTYDDRGRAVRLSDAVDNAIAYTYDGWRLQSRVFTPAASQGDTAHTWQYAYDDDGRIESLTRNAGDTGTGDTEYTESRTYDPVTGRVASLSVASEGVGMGTIHYGYDYAGGLSEISALGLTALYDYDEAGRLSRVESPGGVQTITYNSSGLRTRCVTETDEGNYVEERAYDALGHLLTQTHKRPDGTISFQIEYTLAPDGNRLRAVETRQTAGETPVTETVTWDYTYDRLGRLVGEKRTEGESPSTVTRDITYTYDAESNRRWATDNIDAANTEEYQYDANGRLEHVLRPDGSRTDYTWTANGEQASVTKVDSGGVATECQEFAWDGVGDRTLESVTFSESDGSGGLALQGRVEYDYDHAGEKIARRVYDAGGALLSHRKYLVDHQNPTGYSQTLAELEIVDPATGRPSEAADAAARVARLNTFDPLGPVAQTDFEQTDTGLSKTYRHLFADPLGSIRTLTSQTDSGTIESADEDYTAFGTPINGSLTSGEPPAATPQYAFTAQTRDPYSELQCHRARWLNTGLGQWMSSDSVFDFPSNFGCPYVYAADSPIAATDLTGKSSLTELMTAVGFSGQLAALNLVPNVAMQLVGGRYGAELDCDDEHRGYWFVSTMGLRGVLGPVSGSTGVVTMIGLGPLRIAKMRYKVYAVEYSFLKALFRGALSAGFPAGRKEAIEMIKSLVLKVLKQLGARLSDAGTFIVRTLQWYCECENARGNHAILKTVTTKYDNYLRLAKIGFGAESENQIWANATVSDILGYGVRVVESSSKTGYIGVEFGGTFALNWGILNLWKFATNTSGYLGERAFGVVLASVGGMNAIERGWGHSATIGFMEKE